MKVELTKIRYLLVFLIASLLLASCGVVWQDSVRSFRLPALQDSDESSPIANGERIYFTATNESGQRLSYTDGPRFGGMMMQVMDAPDIRYIALSSEADEHAEEGEDQHEDEHAGYDLEDFRLAVIEGRHPTGAPLSSDMPRWRISDTDLADLFAYLKAIP
jgi:hypothetical protein